MQRLNKYVVTAFFFILMLVFIGVSTLFHNSVPIIKEIFSANTIYEKIAYVDGVYNNSLSNFDDFLNIYSLAQVVMDSQLYDDLEYGILIKDGQGKLHFPYTYRDVAPLVKETITFSDKLNELNIPLVYVQAPNKNLKGYTTFPIGGYNYSNESADDYLTGLKENGINCLDLRELIISEDLNRDKLFYKTDHHWTTRTAFWGFQKVITHLNDNYNLNLDGSYFYRNINNYKITKYPNCFLGSLGRRVGAQVVGLDDYDFIEPAFETNYEVIYPLNNPTIPLWVGNFHDTIVRDSILNNIDVETNKHASYFEYDYGSLIIKNKSINNDTKILLIKDSFALPFAAFLSTSVSELHMIDFRREDAPIPSEYIESNDFDAVIILYNTEVFGSPMFNLNSK